MPWLGHLIPTPKDTSVKDRRDQFVTLAERAIVEVLENGPEHAFDLKGEVGREHWLRPPERDGRSFLLCSLTRGGKSSWDRLHILAMDNGYGISRTLRWQHPGLDSPVSDLLVNLLKRQLHQRGIPGHNGIGLWWLHDLACTFEGQMSIVTEDDLSDDGNAVGVTVGYRQGAAPTTTPTPLPTLPFRGTLVDATFVVPRTSGVMWHRPLAEREPSDSDVAVGANA
jgi:hypothetical protein